MESPAANEIPSKPRSESPDLGGVFRLFCAALLFVMTIPPMVGQVQPQAKPVGAEPTPAPAITAILASFDNFEVVAMPEGHGMKDLDDFIFFLNPQSGVSEEGERHCSRVRQLAVPASLGPLYSRRGCIVP